MNEAGIAGDSSGMDAGSPGDTYPAFKPDVGRIVKGSGYAMHDPVFVAVTWNSDPSQSLIDAFVEGLGRSAYWQTVAQEYGLGAAVGGASNRVHIADKAPPTLTETSDARSDLWMLITASAGTTWPASTKDTAYVVFVPPGTRLLVETGDAGAASACSQGIYGYHGAVKSGDDEIAYAVIPSCRPKGSPVPQLSTIAMSHELVETAANPFGIRPPLDSTGWYGFDPSHFAFAYFSELQAELADVCEFASPSFFMGDNAFPYFLQRVWSNAGGAAGHDPCVPPPARPYFNVTPLDLGDVQVTVPASVSGAAATTFATRGLRLADGQTGSFAVGFYSDQPTAGPWSVGVSPGNPILAQGDAGDRLAQSNPSRLQASIDRAMGQNGDTAQVTVTVMTTGNAFQGELLTLTSTLDGVSNTMPVWIGAQ